MMDSISRPVTEFCLDLYKKLNRSAEDTNIVFSPMSISVALALLHLGAKNNTAAQIENVSMNASTLLAVHLMEMLGIPAWHMCKCLTGNLHKGRHCCCLHICAWSTMIPAICWCESHHITCKSTEQGLTVGGDDTAQWRALAFHKPAGRISGFISELWTGASSCGCYGNPKSGSLGGESLRHLKGLHLGG